MPLYLWACVLGCATGLLCAWSEELPPRGVGGWPVADLGNHRARVVVDVQAAAVRVHIPWRRRDADPANKAIIVVDAATGQRLRNVFVASVTREAGDVVFQPTTAPGEYFIYYMPWTADYIQWNYVTHYTPPSQTADPEWLAALGLSPDGPPSDRWRELPAAKVVAIEARTQFDRFDPMEVIATKEEIETLLAAHPDAPYLVFPEDREHPIRMTDDLPVRWIELGPRQEFRGEAQPGEFYVFQLGVWAARQAIDNLEASFSDLRPTSGPPIPAGAIHRFNLSGIDWLGRPLKREVSVPQGKVQPLWFGVPVPRDAKGEYRGTIVLRPANAPETHIGLKLSVRGQVLPDAGDGDLWRLSRLRWLDSTLGLDDEPTPPYTPVQAAGRAVSCLGRRLRFGTTGLPESILAWGHELLANPIEMVAEAGGKKLNWTGGNARLLRKGKGSAEWESLSRAGPLTMSVGAKMEFDGYVNFRVSIQAREECALQDLRLEIPLRREKAKYMMGLGRKGGFRPEQWDWHWDINRCNNMVWLGDVTGGLYCKLKWPEATWELYSLHASGLPRSWWNDGRGGCTVREEGDRVVFRAYSGARTMKAGETLDYWFGLLITPVKPLDPAHFSQRYYHMGPAPVEEVLKCGANIINIHHGNDLNPHINYPFLRTAELKRYVDAAHEKGVKVKIYYTVRELSTRLPELWALRSLGHEIFVPGPGGGHSWLQEHLISDYAPAWHHIFPDGDVDAAIATTGLSRWHNYYIEGLRWLLENVGIDGLYLDGIGYDREIMKRVRRVLDRTRPGCLIDFHSGNEFPFGDLRVSPACKYMEHFPYINSLWFGEGYDYNETPDYWLVEISGIPFGLYGEMLEGNGNPWRGMIYGMTARYYSGADPKHIWRLWDDFGIAEAKMMGYWDPACPVRTDNPDVLATAYVKKGTTLVSVASWAPKTARVRLIVDWKALGLDPTRAHFYAPSVPGFQDEALFGPDDLIPVRPRRGWMFIVDEQARQGKPAPVEEDARATRRLLFEESFDRAELGEPWRVVLSPRQGTALKLDAGALVIQATANSVAFAERPLPAGVTMVEARVFSGTDRGATWGPGIALLWPNGACRINLRAEGRFGVYYGTEAFGGMVAPNSWYYLRLRLDGNSVLAEASEDGEYWDLISSIDRSHLQGDPVAVRVGKMSPPADAVDFDDPGPMGTCAIDDLRAWAPK